jgi:iron-sulfur cluster insertion protein
METAFSLSDAAAAQINALRQKEGDTSLRFRVTVKGGGCSGFQYEFSLDNASPGPQDIIFENHGAQVIVDDISLGVIKGSQLDYTEDLAQAGFAIKNPNATAKCGCGNSFSVSL